MCEFVHNHIIKPLVVVVNPHSCTVFGGKIHRKMRICKIRVTCTNNVQKMHVAIRGCKAAANFATDQQPVPRRAYRLRYAELAPPAGPYLECKREQGAAAPGSYPNSRPAGHGHGCESVTDFS